MLGARRFVQTHPNTQNIIAGISLDNLGKQFYSGMDIEAVGQFHGVGPLWLQRLAGRAAQAAGDLWVPHVRSPLDQLLGQATPISFMDEGPLIAAGVPALGFSGIVPPEAREQHRQTYHSPEDILTLQSPQVLQQSGRITEALLRQLLLMQSFPQESGPYLYFEAHEQVLSGLPLWALFAGFVAVFFLGSGNLFRAATKKTSEKDTRALPHFLGLWLPLVGGVWLLYGLVWVGLLDTYVIYPATTKDPALLQPHWPAIVLFLLGLGLFRVLAKHLLRQHPKPDPLAIRSLALRVVGLAGLYVLIQNPFSLLFFIPLVSWFFITGRRGLGRLLDLLLFLLGGTMVYALFYFFGFVILRINFAILWYILMMFSIREIDPLTALTITAILAAGLSLIVTTEQVAEPA